MLFLLSIKSPTRQADNPPGTEDKPRSYSPLAMTLLEVCIHIAKTFRLSFHSFVTDFTREGSWYHRFCDISGIGELLDFR